jgi:hypothetical protein
MNEIVNQSATDYLFKIFVLAIALVFFWILESVWKNDRRWLVPIIVFPCAIFLFVFSYWEETRAKCFFAALILIIMLIVSGIVGFDFFDQIMHILKVIAFWPYYLTSAIAVYIFPAAA